MALANDNTYSFVSTLPKIPGIGWQVSGPELTDTAVSLYRSYCAYLVDACLFYRWVPLSLTVGDRKKKNAKQVYKCF